MLPHWSMHTYTVAMKWLHTATTWGLFITQVPASERLWHGNRNDIPLTFSTIIHITCKFLIIGKPNFGAYGNKSSVRIFWHLVNTLNFLLENLKISLYQTEHRGEQNCVILREPCFDEIQHGLNLNYRTCRNITTWKKRRRTSRRNSDCFRNSAKLRPHLGLIQCLT